MRVSLAELLVKAKPCGEIGEYFFRQMVDYNNINTINPGWPLVESWSLGDSPAETGPIEKTTRDTHSAVVLPLITGPVCKKCAIIIRESSLSRRRAECIVAIHSWAIRCQHEIHRGNMASPATIQKQKDLMVFISRELAHEPAIQAVIGIGSIASGLARPDSDIDAIIFLDPFDWYIVPAEFKWRAVDGSFHSIFKHIEGCMQFDFARFDLTQWKDPTYKWPEERCAELQQGWLAFDRYGQVETLIKSRITYSKEMRIAKLDEALVWMDQHLTNDGPQKRWDSLGPVIAHDRMQAAYEYLVQALFAYNHRWRPWRNREMSSLLALPWLPEGFADRIPGASCTPSLDHVGYLCRVGSLRSLFQDLINRLVMDGEYGEDAVGEAFIRMHNEPGRAWNMDEWNRKHVERGA